MSRWTLYGAVSLALLAGCIDRRYPAPGKDDAGQDGPQGEPPLGPACGDRGIQLKPRAIAQLVLPPQVATRNISDWLRVEVSPDGKRLLFLQSITEKGLLQSVNLETGEHQLLLTDMGMTDLVRFTADGRVALVMSVNPEVADVHWLRAIWLEDGRVVTLSRTMAPVAEGRNTQERVPQLLPFVLDARRGAVVTSEQEPDGSHSLVSLSLEDGSRMRLASQARFFGQPYDASGRTERVFYTEPGGLSEWLLAEGRPRYLLPCEATCPDVAMSEDGRLALATRTSWTGVHTLYQFPFPALGEDVVVLGEKFDELPYLVPATRFSPDGRLALAYEAFRPKDCLRGYDSQVFRVDLPTRKMELLSDAGGIPSPEVVFSPDSSKLLLPLEHEREACYIGQWPSFRLYLYPSDFSSSTVLTLPVDPGRAFGARAITRNSQWALWEDNFAWYSGSHVVTRVKSKDLYANRLDQPAQPRSIGQIIYAWASLGDSQVVWSGTDGGVTVHDLEANVGDSLPCEIKGPASLLSSPDRSRVLVVSPRTGVYPELRPGAGYVSSEDGGLVRISSRPWDDLDKTGRGFFKWVDSHRLLMLDQDMLSILELP